MNAQKARPARYRLTFQGDLGDRSGFLPAGMRMSLENGTTVLTGPVADQAQLTGIISRTQELGLELLSVTPLGKAGQGAADDQRPSRPQPSSDATRDPDLP
jgi:hypothetical protein